MPIEITNFNPQQQLQIAQQQTEEAKAAERRAIALPRQFGAQGSQVMAGFRARQAATQEIRTEQAAQVAGFEAQVQQLTPAATEYGKWQEAATLAARLKAGKRFAFGLPGDVPEDIKEMARGLASGKKEFLATIPTTYREEVSSKYTTKLKQQEQQMERKAYGEKQLTTGLKDTSKMKGSELVDYMKERGVVITPGNLATIIRGGSDAARLLKKEETAKTAAEQKQLQEVYSHYAPGTKLYKVPSAGGYVYTENAPIVNKVSEIKYNQNGEPYLATTTYAGTPGVSPAQGTYFTKIDVITSKDAAGNTTTIYRTTGDSGTMEKTGLSSNVVMYTVESQKTNTKGEPYTVVRTYNSTGKASGDYFPKGVTTAATATAAEPAKTFTYEYFNPDTKKFETDTFTTLPTQEYYVGVSKEGKVLTPEELQKERAAEEKSVMKDVGQASMAIALETSPLYSLYKTGTWLFGQTPETYYERRKSLFKPLLGDKAYQNIFEATPEEYASRRGELKTTATTVAKVAVATQPIYWMAKGGAAATKWLVGQTPETYYERRKAFFEPTLGKPMYEKIFEATPEEYARRRGVAATTTAAVALSMTPMPLFKAGADTINYLFRQTPETYYERRKAFFEPLLGEKAYKNVFEATPEEYAQRRATALQIGKAAVLTNPLVLAAYGAYKGSTALADWWTRPEAVTGRERVATKRDEIAYNVLSYPGEKLAQLGEWERSVWNAPKAVARRERIATKRDELAYNILSYPGDKLAQLGGWERKVWNAPEAVAKRETVATKRDELADTILGYPGKKLDKLGRWEYQVWNTSEAVATARDKALPWINLYVNAPAIATTATITGAIYIGKIALTSIETQAGRYSAYRTEGFLRGRYEKQKTMKAEELPSKQLGIPISEYKSGTKVYEVVPKDTKELEQWWIEPARQRAYMAGVKTVQTAEWFYPGWYGAVIPAMRWAPGIVSTYKEEGLAKTWEKHGPEIVGLASLGVVKVAPFIKLPGAQSSMIPRWLPPYLIAGQTPLGRDVLGGVGRWSQAGQNRIDAALMQAPTVAAKVEDMNKDFENKYGKKITDDEITYDQALDEYSKTESYKRYQKEIDIAKAKEGRWWDEAKYAAYGAVKFFAPTTPSEAVKFGVGATLLFGGLPQGIQWLRNRSISNIGFGKVATMGGSLAFGGFEARKALNPEMRKSERIKAALFGGVALYAGGREAMQMGRGIYWSEKTEVTNVRWAGEKGIGRGEFGKQFGVLGRGGIAKPKASWGERVSTIVTRTKNGIKEYLIVQHKGSGGAGGPSGVAGGGRDVLDLGSSKLRRIGIKTYHDYWSKMVGPEEKAYYGTYSKWLKATRLDVDNPRIFPQEKAMKLAQLKYIYETLSPLTKKRYGSFSNWVKTGSKDMHLQSVLQTAQKELGEEFLNLKVNRANIKEGETYAGNRIHRVAEIEIDPKLKLEVNPKQDVASYKWVSEKELFNYLSKFSAESSAYHPYAVQQPGFKGALREFFLRGGGQFDQDVSNILRRRISGQDFGTFFKARGITFDSKGNLLTPKAEAIAKLKIGQSGISLSTAIGARGGAFKDVEMLKKYGLEFEPTGQASMVTVKTANLRGRDIAIYKNNIEGDIILVRKGISNAQIAKLLRTKLGLSNLDTVEVFTNKFAQKYTGAAPQRYASFTIGNKPVPQLHIRHETVHALETMLKKPKDVKLDAQSLKDYYYLFRNKVSTLPEAKNFDYKQITKAYDKGELGKEARSFIAEYFPEEINNPTTKTGRYLKGLLTTAKVDTTNPKFVKFEQQTALIENARAFFNKQSGWGPKVTSAMSDKEILSEFLLSRTGLQGASVTYMGKFNTVVEYPGTTTPIRFGTRTAAGTFESWKTRGKIGDDLRQDVALLAPGSRYRFDQEVIAEYLAWANKGYPEKIAHGQPGKPIFPFEIYGKPTIQQGIFYQPAAYPGGPYYVGTSYLAIGKGERGFTWSPFGASPSIMQESGKPTYAWSRKFPQAAELEEIKVPISETKSRWLGLVSKETVGLYGAPVGVYYEKEIPAPGIITTAYTRIKVGVSNIKNIVPGFKSTMAIADTTATESALTGGAIGKKFISAEELVYPRTFVPFVYEVSKEEPTKLLPSRISASVTQERLTPSITLPEKTKVPESVVPLPPSRTGYGETSKIGIIPSPEPIIEKPVFVETIVTPPSKAPTPPSEPPKIITGRLIIYDEDKKRIEEKKKKIRPRIIRGYEVLVRRRRKFRVESPFPLGKEEALAFGARRTLGAAAATFRLRPTERPARTMGISAAPELGKYFRTPLPSSKLAAPLTFVQKERQRITTFGEKKEISFKGMGVKRQAGALTRQKKATKKISKMFGLNEVGKGTTTFKTSKTFKLKGGSRKR